MSEGKWQSKVDVNLSKTSAVQTLRQISELLRAELEEKQAQLEELKVRAAKAKRVRAQDE